MRKWFLINQLIKTSVVNNKAGTMSVKGGKRIVGKFSTVSSVPASLATRFVIGRDHFILSACDLVLYRWKIF